MLDGLNIILHLSEEYGLNKPENILRILGLGSADSLSERYQVWDKEKKKSLYGAATNIIALKTVTESHKRTFIQTLVEFCEHTKEMNKGYTATVIDALNGTIK